VLGIYVGFLTGILVWRILVELETPFYGAPANEVFIQIPKGASTSRIADTLVAAGVLRQRLPFLSYLSWTGASRHLQAGEYRFDQPSRPTEVAGRLMRGDIFYVSVTIPEGLTAEETIAQINRQGLGNPADLKKALSRTDWISDLDSQAHSLEGYLFPDTYRFPRGVSSETILQTMVREFRARFTKLLASRPLPTDRTTREVVILASLVEKEAKNAEERGLVASVLTNRLVKRMPLACDPTVIYALKLAGKYDGNLRRADLKTDSSYNTYVHAGLPPGPIANPGQSALEAALSPQQTQYLYYVSRNDGTHFFSKDFRTHTEAVARYQKRVHR
jgi:UPF0755 protein